MRFSKMQGVGNDFVVLDADALSPDTDWAELAMRLCERHVGVGADGLLTVSRTAPPAEEALPAPNNGGAGSEEPDASPSPPFAKGAGGISPPALGAGGPSFAMRMFNPDGTEDMCGNGLRCICLWAHQAGWLGERTEFMVATKEGSRRCRLIEVANDGRSAQISVDMGLPRFAPADVPVCAPTDERMVDRPLSVGGVLLSITSLNTGSTHTVIFGEEPDEATFQRLSPLIETHPLFPERTTVLWATPQGDNTVAVRIWERGVGETLGCGTGACAVGVAARLHGLVSAEAPTRVVSRGGTLQIDWPGEGAPITMTGPAEFVFEGEFAFAAP